MSPEESTGVAVHRVRDMGGSGSQTKPKLLPRQHRFRLGLFALVGKV